MTRDSNRPGSQRFDKQIVAYVDPWTVQPGQRLSVRVSCYGNAPDYRANVVRLISGDSRPRGTGFRETPVDGLDDSFPARRQSIYPGSYATLPVNLDLPEFTFGCAVQPTRPDQPREVLLSTPGFYLEIRRLRLVLVTAMDECVLDDIIRASRWHRVRVSWDGSRLGVAVTRLGASMHEPDVTRRSEYLAVTELPTAGTWVLGADRAMLPDVLPEAEPFAGRFNGRVDSPWLVGTADALRSAALGDAANPIDAQPDVERAAAHAQCVAAWDFARSVSTTLVEDVGPHHRHGKLHQLPTRAVRGVRWNGLYRNFADAPDHYSAVHFHDDDLYDAAWDEDFAWTVPSDLPSGVYALKLAYQQHSEYVPFFVRARTPGSTVAYLASTASYLAYANQRLVGEGIVARAAPRDENEDFLYRHPELGLSLYEHHSDGSGVHMSSRLRPVLNMKPHTLTWAFNADTNITAWLDHIGQGFDVVTDEDLHLDGAASLAGYRVLITGTHPEYYSTRMLNALEDWLEDGGRLMYMGGNGFYWRIAYNDDCTAIEVRRAEDGTRAWIAEPGEYHHAFNGEYGGLWRRLGRPPNQLVGVGFAAQGFDGGTHYRLRQSAADSRVDFAMVGMSGSPVIGDYGTQGGGAAGEEIDRFDLALGSPPHAIVLASSENHRPGMLRAKEEFYMMEMPTAGPDVRADIVFFETAHGGAVFSTGSISYAGALSHNTYQNDIETLTRNVLKRFDDPTPFEHPDGATDGETI